MIFSRLRRAKIVHYIRKYLNDNFHFSGNHHSKNRTDTPFKLFHSPAFAPPAELKQASKMLGWEIPSPLEENPTHTYDFKHQFELQSEGDVVWDWITYGMMINIDWSYVG